MFGALLLEGKQRVYPFYRDLSLLPKISERNVDESFAQSRQQLGARDFHHGKQRVSPFYRDLQLLHEKNVFRSPENGTFFFHLARSLGRTRQRVSPFYHDLGLDLVGLIGNFRIAEQLPLVVEHLLCGEKRSCEGRDLSERATFCSQSTDGQEERLEMIMKWSTQCSFFYVA